MHGRNSARLLRRQWVPRLLLDQRRLGQSLERRHQFAYALYCNHRVGAFNMPAVNEHWTRGAGGGIGMSDHQNSFHYVRASWQPDNG